MYKKVLIANRGAIASRIIRTLNNLSIQSVAVYHDADADSLHVEHATEAYNLGNGRLTQTYLDQEKILQIAKDCGAEAIHPGYGFLSENPDFVQACETAGIDFIGPSADHMRAFGLKHAARELAQTASVPLLPGTDLLKDLDQALAQAEHIGYPVMLKSTAGGGGIGMQLCHGESELRKAYESVRRLSQSNFANDGVFLEKFIEHARHIEVQIFGDGEGQALALGERDCSVQRRNQKVIEETPAPNLSDSIRQQMQQTAVRLAALVKYRNAGTVEYVYDSRNEQFYFLEVNTRLQVEHGVTEQVYGVDLVEWMIKLSAGALSPINDLTQAISPKGHAIQARVYAEDPNRNFQPSAGLLSQVDFPQTDGLRVDHWIRAGIEISPLFDPMLAKIIYTGENRDSALQGLKQNLNNCSLYGIQTNLEYLQEILNSPVFGEAKCYTRYLDSFDYCSQSLEIVHGGTMSSIQDYPGRNGYWDVGVPPSGPFDSRSFRLGNRLLQNPENSAGLEITLNGPSIRFHCDSLIVLTGALMQASLDEQTVAFWQPLRVKAGQLLKIGKTESAGARSYLLIKGGIQCPEYLGSRSTFTLGQFGGHAGRAIKTGDVLYIRQNTTSNTQSLQQELIPCISSHWQLRVIYGPHGAPDFFTQKYIETFFSSDWEVHYNSSRTGIRLVGPKPEWARRDGGEAGMHPSNIHDNAYGIGTVDFTGDMPVILGPDGPSLGGFVCPATVIKADLWKLGQLKAGDKIKFIPVTIKQATIEEQGQIEAISTLKLTPGPKIMPSPASLKDSPVLHSLHRDSSEQLVYRPSGDKYLLVEFGPHRLDIELRFKVHALMLWLNKNRPEGIKELTPGIRSLQIHYDSLRLCLDDLMQVLLQAEKELKEHPQTRVPSRIVHLPLSWDDAACHQAIEKYMKSVRPDAPWCPSNIEFIRRINGLDSVDQVKQTVFSANYLVMGLGDVYLGAPVATPLDPRHRLVTTKYNPARTWTAENSVGIGGSYLCVYGMEGPGGYQFVGRTIQMWNRYRQTPNFEKPWLLRFFDQIRFYEVGPEELKQARRDFPNGNYPIKIEPTEFDLHQYKSFLCENEQSITEFQDNRSKAFDEELQRWMDSGQINFESEQHLGGDTALEEQVPENCVLIESPVAGSVWKLLVQTGDTIKSGQVVAILESMKMEIEINSPHDGVVYAIKCKEGSQINAGQSLLILAQE